MKKQMKPSSLSFLLFLVVWAVLLPAQPRLRAEDDEEDYEKHISVEEVQARIKKLFEASPKLKQNMRPIRTISYRYYIEESRDDGREWVVTRQSRVTIDLNKGNLNIAAWVYNKNSEVFDFEKNVLYNGRRYHYRTSGGSLSERPENPFEFNEKISRYESFGMADGYDLTKLHFLEMRAYWWNFTQSSSYTYAVHRLADSLTDKDLMTSIKDIILDYSPDEARIDTWEGCYVISKSRGVITKELGYRLFDGGRRGSTETVTKNFITKNGITVPLVLETSHPGAKPGDYSYKRHSRVIVDEKTLRINEELLPSEFSISARPGTRVSDGVKNKNYTLSAPFESFDIKDSVAHLDAMLKKAREANK